MNANLHTTHADEGWIAPDGTFHGIDQKNGETHYAWAKTNHKLDVNGLIQKGWIRKAASMSYNVPDNASIRRAAAYARKHHPDLVHIYVDVLKHTGGRYGRFTVVPYHVPVHNPEARKRLQETRADVLIKLVLSEEGDYDREARFLNHGIGYIHPDGKAVLKKRWTVEYHDNVARAMGMKDDSTAMHDHGAVRLLSEPERNRLGLELNLRHPHALKNAADYIEKNGMGRDVELTAWDLSEIDNNRHILSPAGSGHAEVFRALRGEAPKIKTQIAKFRDYPEPKY